MIGIEKLLEIVINKIMDKQEKIRELKYKTEDVRRYIELESKDAGLSVATSIIGNMIWRENVDYFKEESEMDLLDYLERLSEMIEIHFIIY